MKKSVKIKHWLRSGHKKRGNALPQPLLTLNLILWKTRCKVSTFFLSVKCCARKHYAKAPFSWHTSKIVHPLSSSFHIQYLIQPRNEIILSPAKTINIAFTLKSKTFIRKSKAYICTNKTFTARSDFKSDRFEYKHFQCENNT